MKRDTLVIETENLTKRFKKVVAVDGLNLQIQQGEIFGLVGPDGSGKTTTIRLLAAIMDPTEGWAKVAGFDTVRQPEAIKQRIGYMAQRFNLYGDLSVWENLNFFADVFEMVGQERQERIQRLLRFRSLERISRPPCRPSFWRNAEEIGPGLHPDPYAADHLPGRTDHGRGSRIAA